MLLETPRPNLGTVAPDFELKDAAGQIITRDLAAGRNGLVVAFICNHCPYVVAVAARLAHDIEQLVLAGIILNSLCWPALVQF